MVFPFSTGMSYGGTSQEEMMMAELQRQQAQRAAAASQVNQMAEMSRGGTQLAAMDPRMMRTAGAGGGGPVQPTVAQPVVAQPVVAQPVVGGMGGAGRAPAGAPPPGWSVGNLLPPRANQKTGSVDYDFVPDWMGGGPLGRLDVYDKATGRQMSRVQKGSVGQLRDRQDLIMPENASPEEQALIRLKRLQAATNYDPRQVIQGEEGGLVMSQQEYRRRKQAQQLFEMWGGGEEGRNIAPTMAAGAASRGVDVREGEATETARKNAAFEDALAKEVATERKRYETSRQDRMEDREIKDRLMRSGTTQELLTTGTANMETLPGFMQAIYPPKTAEGFQPPPQLNNEQTQKIFEVADPDSKVYDQSVEARTNNLRSLIQSSTSFNSEAGPMPLEQLGQLLRGFRNRQRYPNKKGGQFEKDVRLNKADIERMHGKGATETLLKMMRRGLFSPVEAPFETIPRSFNIRQYR